MTELAIRDAGTIVSERDVVDGWIQVAADVSKLADYIAETEFVPKSLRNKPAAIAACILTGRELGIGPMASLKSIHMVQGVPSLSAEYKRARAMAAGHQISIDDSTSTRCVVRGRRAGTDHWVTITWTLDMASRAKISGKDVWRQYPQRMLQARATSELCDLLFPDATLGLETTEVLEDGGALALAIGTELAAEPETPKPAQRTARRRQAAPQTVSPAEQPLAAPPSAPPAEPAGEAPMPPLPGEVSDEAIAESERANRRAAEPDETDYDSPGTASGPQLTAIWTNFTTAFKFGNDEKEQARAVCAHIIGRPVTSTKDMSHNEARTVLDTLANWREVAERNKTAPREFLIELMATAGQGAGDE